MLNRLIGRRELKVRERALQDSGERYRRDSSDGGTAREERYPPPSTIGDVKPGHHVCCIYETEAEHRAVIVPFLRQGLERGEKVLYIVDARDAESILGHLRQDGLDPDPYLESGQLSVLTAQDVYLKDGVFDPDAMIALLRAETDQASAEGYAALRVTGEMSWALRGLPGSERLIEYEAKLNQFFPGSKCLAICQYDRRAFSASLLLDVLTTHPIAVVGTSVHDNLYYVPAADLLGPDPQATRLRAWVEHLGERKRMRERTEEQDSFVDSLLNVLRHPFYVIDVEDYTVRVANPAGGLDSASSLITCYAIAHGRSEPCGADGHICPLERVKNTKVPVTVEHVHRDLDGNESTVEVHCHPLLDREGNVKEVIEYIVDTTERKELQAALSATRDRERFLADVLDRSSEAFAAGYPDGRLMTFNAAYCELLGYGEEELRRVNWLRDLTAPEWREVVAEVADEIRRTGRPRRFEEEYLRKDGSQVPVELLVSPVLDEKGDVEYYCSFVTDITERKQAEDELRRSEDRSRSLLAAIPDMMFILGQDGTYLDFIAADGQKPLSPPSEFLGRTVLEVMPTGLARRMMHHIEAALKSGEVQKFEYELELDGEEHNFEARFVAMAADEVLAIARDVTAEQRLEQEQARRRARDELEGKVERAMLGRNPYGLTFREFSVLHLVARGAADKEIADNLGISTFTVNKHVANILGKMNASCRTEAGVRAHREGFLT